MPKVAEVPCVKGRQSSKSIIIGLIGSPFISSGSLKGSLQLHAESNTIQDKVIPSAEIGRSEYESRYIGLLLIFAGSGTLVELQENEVVYQALHPSMKESATCSLFRSY